MFVCHLNVWRLFFVSLAQLYHKRRLQWKISWIYAVVVSVATIHFCFLLLLFNNSVCSARGVYFMRIERAPNYEFITELQKRAQRAL